ERIAAFVAGLNYLDERLPVALQPIESYAHHDLTSSQQRGVDRALELLLSAASDVTLQIVGADRMTRRAIGGAIADQLGARLLILTADSVPPASETETLIELWRRERQLLSLVLLIELPDIDASAEGLPLDAHAPLTRLQRIASRAGGRTLVSARDAS